MKNDYTDITFVLDRSGSMHSIWSDVEGALNDFLEKNKAIPGKVTFTLVVFDKDGDKVCIDTVYNAVDIRSINKVNLGSYPPRGWTPLHDAMGITIKKTGERLAALSTNERPSKVLFGSMTDGLENASKEFNSVSVKDMVEHQTNKYGWEFIYLGANQDAVAVAQTMGIVQGNARNFEATSRGVAEVTRLNTRGAVSFRSSDYVAGNYFSGE